MKNRILQGDAKEVLKKFPDESVDCVITSPPYWALRDYGVAGQLGLEPTFQEYIIKLCDIFDEVKRVLKKTGTCWVNLGDTYGIQSGAMRDGKFGKKNTNNQAFVQPVGKHKCLCQIPSRFAIEMTDRGWILRNEIIWHKPNCMPSSVKDRFTVDFEKIFFFTKNKKYYFKTQLETARYDGRQQEEMRGGGKYLNRVICPGHDKHSFAERGHQRWQTINGKHMRNKRAVWTINNKPYKDAHFAVFPPELPRQCIEAGCPEFVCQKCGKIKQKLFKTNNPKGITGRAGKPMVSKNGKVDTYDGKQRIEPGHNSTVYSSAKFIGWEQCDCGVGFEQGIVLDPFCGSGTTLLVAKQLGRDYIGIDLNRDYIKQAEKRINSILI